MSNTMQFWFKYNNGKEQFQLPVNPEEIRIQSGYTWNTVNITQFGEYSIPSGHELTRISISSFLPRDHNSSYCEYQNIPNPKEIIDKIGRWKEGRMPMRLIVTGFGGSALNYPMTIEKLEFWEQAGSPGDIYFTIDLREYRFISLTPVAPAISKTTGLKTVMKAASKPPRPNEKQIPKTYTVKSGDSLTKIAARLRTLGHKNIDANKLYLANKALIGKDRNVIKPGQVLNIP